jgi:hypothetical protein
MTMGLFEDRQRLLAVQRFMRRLIDTSAEIAGLPNDPRADTRYNRAVPVLLAPYENGQPLADESTYALTKNLSSQGMALILPQPLRAEQVVVGIWAEAQGEFMVGRVRDNVALGGGFWHLGLELTAPLDTDRVEAFQELSARARWLVPRTVNRSLALRP